MNMRTVFKKNGFTYIDEVDERGRCTRQNIVKDGELVRAYVISYRRDDFEPSMVTTLGTDSKPTSITHYAGELPVRTDEIGPDLKPTRQTFFEYDGRNLIRRRIKDVTSGEERVIDEPSAKEPPKLTREGQYGLGLEETDPAKDEIDMARRIARKNSMILRNRESEAQKRKSEAIDNRVLEEHPSSPEGY